MSDDRYPGHFAVNHKIQSANDKLYTFADIPLFCRRGPLRTPPTRIQLVRRSTATRNASHLHFPLVFNHAAYRFDHSLRRLSRFLSTFPLLLELPTCSLPRSNSSALACCAMMPTNSSAISRRHAITFRHFHSRRLSRNHRAEHSSRGSFSGHQKRQRVSFLFVAHEHVVPVDFGRMSLFFNSFATVLFPPPSLDAMSAPTAERKMRHLVFESFLFAWLSRIVFSGGLPFSKLFLFLLLSSAPLTSRVQHRRPSRYSSRIHPVFQFGYSSVHELLLYVGSR